MGEPLVCVVARGRVGVVDVVGFDLDGAGTCRLSQCGCYKAQTLQNSQPAGKTLKLEPIFRLPPLRLQNLRRVACGFRSYRS